jgi:hypothetical protein
MLGCALSTEHNQQTAAPDPPTSSSSTSTPAPIQPGQTQNGQEPIDKRVFGVLPNYRTANESAVYTPISVQHKFVIGLKDSFDYPLMLVGAVYAGIGQVTNQHPAFGQGVAGYARRLGTGYADQAIGNLMTESIWPSMLREDPRYFRRGQGPVGSRLWYAVTRVMVTKTDAGGTRFNFSEWLGNGAATAISNAYYPDGHTVSANVSHLLVQVGTDAISQVLKEFWPDVKRRWFHKNPPASASMIVAH